MPKNKTHSGTKKRVRVSGTGKLMRERAGARHMFERKSSRLTRRLAGDVQLAPGDARKYKKLLGL